MPDPLLSGAERRHQRKLERQQEKASAAQQLQRQRVAARVRSVGVIVLVAAGAVAGLWWLVSASTPANEREALLAFTMREHNNPAAHYHPHLDLRIHGQSVQLPANIGITGLGMRVIHTHDASGEIHIEAPRLFPFTLGDFFTVWDRPFSQQCLLDACVSATGTLTMMVNGATSTEYADYVMRDGDRIELILE